MVLQQLGHRRKGEAEYHLNFLTPKTERFLVQLVILKRRKRTFAWHLTPSKQSQKERKLLLCYRSPDHCVAKQWYCKEKRQIIKFYNFTKGETDIVDQLNGYCTTRSKSCRWVMVPLSCMLDTARFNGKPVWCLKNDSRTSSYDFSWNLAKALALPHVKRISVAASSVQLKIKTFLETALLVDDTVPKVEKKFKGNGQRRRCQLHMANCHTNTE